VNPWWIVAYVLAVLALSFAVAYAHGTLKRWFWRRESIRQRGFDVKLNTAENAKSTVNETREN
jgi:hypothetical protein